MLGRTVSILNPRTHPWLWSLVGIAGSVALGWLGLRNIQWPAVAQAFQEASWRALLPAMVMITVSTLLQTLRWKILLPHEKVSITRLYFVRHAGLTVNQLLPLRVGGEATELAMLTHAGKLDGGNVVASIFLGRVLDLVVTTTMMGVGFFSINQLSVFRPVIIPSIVLVTLALGAVLFSRYLGRIGPLQRVGFVRDSIQSVAGWRNHIPRLVVAAVLTIGAWTSLGTGAWLIAQGLGITLPFWIIAVLLVVLISFSSVVPAGAGSVGVFGLATISLLGLFTINNVAALNFAVIMQSLIVFPSLAVGLTVLSREHQTLHKTSAKFGRFLLATRGRTVG